MSFIGCSASKRYVVVGDAIRDLIRMGSLKPGQRLPSMRELMAAHGVSLSTVIRAIESLEEEGWVRRVHGKGIFACDPPKSRGPWGIGFPDGFVAEPGSLRGAAVAVVCHQYPRDGSLHNVCFDRLLRGAEYAVQTLGGRFNLLSLPPCHVGNAAAILGSLQGLQANAVIGVGGHWAGSEIRRISEHLAEQHTPLIQVYADAYPGVHIHRVTVDGAAGMRLIVRHVRELGHTRLAFLGWHEYLWSREREEATALALGEGPLTVVRFTNTAEVRAQIRAELVPTAGRFTAYCAANDRLAAMVLEVLREHGVRVPQDASVTGFDDDYQFRSLHLTTVGLPLEEVAAAAAHLAAWLLRNGSETVVHEVRLEPRLLVRDTTGPAPAPNGSGSGGSAFPDSATEGGRRKEG